MTYCLAIKVRHGVVFAADSRTNAGVDYVSTYSKMFTFGVPGERFFALLTAGNLATTQYVVDLLARDMEDPAAPVGLRKVRYMFDAARYVGELSVTAQHQSHAALKKDGLSAEASFILGGQIRGQPPEIFMIYPQGNFISPPPGNPFLQIGETKYGKPILDRIITPETSLEDAARCALVSLDSTMRSNISVGPPLELGVYENERFELARRFSLEADAPFYTAVQRHWNEGLRRAFARLPRFDWEC